MNTTPAGTPSNATFGPSVAPLNIGAAHGRYQTMARTKDGRFVVVCRCCRNRGESQLFLATPSPASSRARTPDHQVTVDADATQDSPEVKCLCFEMESMSMKDALRRSPRLSNANKAVN